MIIHQVLPTYTAGDAVSNEATIMQSLLILAGHHSEIFAVNVHESVKKSARRIHGECPDLARADILIYHFSIGSPVLDMLLGFRHPKLVMRYHNITPGSFFSLVDTMFKRELDRGRDQLASSIQQFDYALADSNYNKTDLLNLGYSPDRISVMPVIVNYSQYGGESDKEMSGRLDDGKVNILFVGRIAPNKCQEDLIKTIYYYKKYFNDACRLIITGSRQFPLYDNALADLVRELHLGDAVFLTGHVTTPELLAIYKSSHVFLSMSEHEGFCVPVLESMYFGLHVIAYNSSALPETVGDAGLLLDVKDHRIAASAINRMIEDKAFAEYIKKKQNENMDRFSFAAVSLRFQNFITELVKL